VARRADTSPLASDAEDASDDSRGRQTPGGPLGGRPYILSPHDAPIGAEHHVMRGRRSLASYTCWRSAVDICGEFAEGAVGHHAMTPTWGSHYPCLG
jgi:hypothetical protein